MKLVDGTRLFSDDTAHCTVQAFHLRSIDKRLASEGKRFPPRTAKSQEAQGEGKGRPKGKSKARPASSARETRRIWSLPENLLPLPRDRRHRRIGVGGVALHVEFGLAADRQPRAGGRRGSPGRGRQRAHAQHGLAAATPSMGPPLVSTTASIVFMASPSKGLNIS